MAQFSGAVKIGDINDFIAPSQACVVSLQGQKQPNSSNAAAAVKPLKPTEGLQLNARPAKRQQQQQQTQQQPAVKLSLTADNSDASANTTNGAGPQPAQPAAAAADNQPAPPPAIAGGFQQTVLSGDNQAVKVSLNDCLACSGCVTSAETVLLQAQSLKEFMARCEDPDAIVVVSISPQSRASLAALHGISADQVQARVSNFLKHQLSVALVLDTTLGQALALNESAAEFVARYKQSGRLSSSAAAAAVAANGSNGVSSNAGPLPLLASACPGWVCYAEKTHGTYILPHIASTRSPQGIMGSLVKQVLAPSRGWDVSRVYHVTVMPCYDKKLEASRDDFLVPGTSAAEVDSSLTTGELQELLDKFGAGDLTTLQAGRGDNTLSLLMSATQQQQQARQQQGQVHSEPLRVPEPSMHTQPGSSGGYADFIFAAAAAELYGVDVAAACINNNTSNSSKLPWKVLRNADMQELQLQGPDGAPLLRFALAYGFRNIQTIVRQIKTGRCPYDYVEVMACPSGCLNGGGQIKPPKGVSAAQLVEQLELQYFRQETAGLGVLQPQHQQQVQEQQQQAFKVSPGSIQILQPSQQQQQGAGQAVVPACISRQSLAAVYDVVLPAAGASVEQLLHTQYHKREKTVTSTISDW